MVFEHLLWPSSISYFFNFLFIKFIQVTVVNIIYTGVTLTHVAGFGFIPRARGSWFDFQLEHVPGARVQPPELTPH